LKKSSSHQKKTQNTTRQQDKYKMFIEILIVLFGSNVDYLLESRIHAGMEYALSQDNATTSINWLLSGGIKNPTESSLTEAWKMSQLLSQKNREERRRWTYILDEDSTNTAENLVMVKAWTKEHNYDKVLFVTSSFHKRRASIMADEILEGKIAYDWILSPLELKDSVYWEGIFMQNAKQDASNALSKCEMRNNRSI
jgi:hypothetical protein